MTTVATGVSWPFFQKDGLDLRFERLETKSIRRLGSRLHCRHARRRAADPGGEQLPLWIVLRRPEFAACVRRVAARLLCQRVEQKTALQRIVGSHQLGSEFKILPRLLLGPRGIPRQEGLQSKTSGERGMAVVAADSAFTLLEENRLDPSAVLLVIERRLRLRACRRLFCIRLRFLNPHWACERTQRDRTLDAGLQHRCSHDSE